MSDKASTKNVFMVNCHASIKGLFAGMIVFSCTVISVILYAVLRNKIGDDVHSLASVNIHPDFSHPHRIHSREVILTTTLISQHNLLLSSTSPNPIPFRSTFKTPKKILYSIAIVEIVNLCLLIISLSATTLALMKIRKLQYRRTTTRRRRRIGPQIFIESAFPSRVRRCTDHCFVDRNVFIFNLQCICFT